MSIIIKIGTESLTHFETSEKVNKLVRDIAEIIHTTHTRVILVSSGAVGFWRNIRPDIEDKHVLASIWWGRLLEAYSKKFTDQGINIGWILATHADIEDYESSKTRLMETVNAHWKYGVLPIINENDALSEEEMNEVQRGADNDKNALLLAKVFHATQLIIVSNTNGVYKDKDHPDSRIARLCAEELSDDFLTQICAETKSTSGTGGMISKLRVAREAGMHGIRTSICDGIESGIKDHFSGNPLWWTEIYPSEK